MKEITIWINATTMESMAGKIYAHCQSLQLPPSSPYDKLTQSDCHDIIWKNIQKEVTEHCSAPDANLNNLSLALVFGLPLNDTVFMLTGCNVPGQSVEQRSFFVQNHSGGSLTFTADFYALVT